MTPTTNRLKGKGFAPVFLVLLGLLLVLPAPSPAQADGGLALSGSFYRQEFEIPQGSSVSGPSINVVVFNSGSEELTVRLSSQAPMGVSVTLSQTELTLAPHGQQQVLVGVDVAQDAAPGDYEVSVMAESYREGVTGIQLAGAASQKAKLTILGESGIVTAQATSPDGSPVLAAVRLYRVSGDQNLEVAYSETGKLEARVAPGDFVVASYIGGEKVAEERFTLAANENKEVVLSGKTIYFQGFGTVPNFRTSDGKLAFAEIMYSVKNLYQTVPRAEVFLKVSLNGTMVEEFSLANLSPLELGSKEFSYRYIPMEGWQDGEYTFELRLVLDGKIYTTSPIEQVAVSDGVAVDTIMPETTSTVTSTPIPASTAAESDDDGGSSFPMILGIIAVVAAAAIAAGVILFGRGKKTA